MDFCKLHQVEPGDINSFPILLLPFWSDRTSVYFPTRFEQCIFHKPRFSRNSSNILSYGKNQTQDIFFFFLLRGKSNSFILFCWCMYKQTKKAIHQVIFRNLPFISTYIMHYILNALYNNIDRK